MWQAIIAFGSIVAAPPQRLISLLNSSITSQKYLRSVPYLSSGLPLKVCFP
jgi:hypothetical protein